MKKITDTGNFIMRVLTTVLAIVFFLYGVLVLWDMFRTEMKAFASYDLLKYRPNIEEDEPPYLDDLLEINTDTAAWLTIYGTNIDYPIMQGENDDEYLNKDVYGKYSISGSIFMASHNSKDFTDPYTLIYGHHMANGSMFGDIEKFKDKDFFDKNRKGVLILPEKVYNLRVMACFETDAYDHNIYYPDKTEEETAAFVQYIKENSKEFRDYKYDRIVVLSTCNDATSWGRTVLVCAAKKRTTPLPDREEAAPPEHRKAVGHPMAGAYWALLNLVSVLVTLWFGYKFIWLRKDNIKQKKNFVTAGLVIISILLFLVTEDIHKPIQIIDIWTPVMVAIPLILWLCEKHIRDDSREDKRELSGTEQKV